MNMKKPPFAGGFSRMKDTQLSTDMQAVRIIIF